MSNNTFLNAADNDTFTEQGFLIKELLTPEDISALTSLYRQFDNIHQSEFCASVLLADHQARKDIHLGISDILSQRLLPVLNAYRFILGNFVTKKAHGELSALCPHQDLTFSQNERQQAGLTMWCPLTEVTAENGWLGVVPGSHKLNNNFRDGCPLPYPELVTPIEQKYFRYQAMTPGQVLFLDHRTFHGSPPNLSANDRIVSCGVAVAQNAELIYCHGDYANGNNELEVYQVPDDFYLTHAIGQRPKVGKHVGNIPKVVSELTEQQLHQHSALYGH